MKHILMLLVFAMFITGCEGNEKRNTNENTTTLKFDDLWMQRIWDKSNEVNEAYREVARAKKTVDKLEDKMLLTNKDTDNTKHDLDQAKQNLASAKVEADKRRKEFDQLANEHKEEMRRRQNDIYNPDLQNTRPR